MTFGISFSVTDSDDQEAVYRLSADALDIFLTNLEYLARSALIQRLEGSAGQLPFNPNAALPPFQTHGEYFVVEERDANDLTLVVKRQGRTELHIPLNRAQFVKLQNALANSPSDLV